MDFNIELTEFPSAVHSVIYASGRGIMPLSRTLETVTDPAMRESCVALHGFVTDMLSDMYDNPEAYHLPVMKIEEFLGGKNIHEMKREFKVKIKKLDEQVRHVTYRYMDLLWRIGEEGKIENGSIVVSAERPQVIDKRVKMLDKRLESLSRIGLIMETLPTGEYRFISKNYPGMFPALNAIPGDNFQSLDFRGIGSPYKPTHDDYFYALITRQRELAYELHEFAMKYKMRTSLNANKGVVYHYKSKHVMTIWTGCDFKRLDSNCDRSLCVGVIGKDKTDALTVIDEYLGKETQDLREQALKRMSGCDANQCLMCSGYGTGWYETVMGKRHQMCGEGRIFFDWHKPEEADMAMIKRLIEIRCEIIDEAQAAKKAKS